MIKNSEPLSMAEAEEYILKEGNESETANFIKKFIVLSAKESRELAKEIEELGMMKIRPDSVVKIVDLLPESADELNKIFIDVVLDEDETKKILDTIKKYK